MLGRECEHECLLQCCPAVQITVTKDDTIILDGGGNNESISERCAQIRQAADDTTSDYDRDKLQERLAKLSGGVAVLKIGGASEACTCCITCCA